MTPSHAPFTCTYTREVPDILERLGCSLALTTYQAGKVILISPNGQEGLVQLARDFSRPMGLAVEGPRMAVATAHEVVVLENAPPLAASYPRKPAYYDALFVPRALLFSGAVDLHDMAWSGERLWAVNTRFSCLCHIEARYSFVPVWQPRFISALAPEDRCHLNGVAMEGGAPQYVTALGATDTPEGWRADRLGGGVLVDVPSGEVVLGGLAMPHSPRLYDGRLYVLASATGEVLCVDPEAGTCEVVNRVPGFARGLARCGDYLFIGHSRLRKRHVFGDLPVAQRDPVAGLIVLHLPSGRIAGGIRFLASCEEIYDVQALPGLRRPGILGVESAVRRRALSTPAGAYWASAEAEEADAAAPAVAIGST